MVEPPHDSSELPAALADLPGTVLEQRYRLGRVLGAGGMGAVFEARHLRLDRPVAIKVLQPGFAKQGEYIERFLREAKAASRIRHRNVVEILDYGETADGLVYSVMEFLVGQDLQELLKAQPQGRLPWARASGLLVQIASGLKAAHGQGVIHRDIKPANCFLTDEDGEPVIKLVDFGIAKLQGGERGHTLTGTAQVLGTPSYIAPEMVRTKDPASVRSDIYALGVLAYRMLVGTVPFSAPTVFELLRKACFDPVPSLRELVPEIPPRVEAFVLEMMEKAPGDRPSDMKVVRDRLLELSATQGAERESLESSGLPLSMTDGVPSSGTTDDTTVPRRTDPVPAVRAGGAPARGVMANVAVTSTEVVDRPTSVEPMPPASDAGTEVVVGVPQGGVHELASVPPPSPSDETMPVVSESTLQNMETSGPIERPRGHGRLWLALVGVVGAVVAGGVVVPVMSGDDGKGRAIEMVAGAELVESEHPGTTSVSPGSTGGGGELPNVPNDDVAAAVSTGVVLGTDDESSGAAPQGEFEAGRALGDEEDAPVVTTTGGGDTSPDAEAEAVPPPKPPKRKRSTVSVKAAGPPVDSVVIKKLRRKISNTCAKALSGTAVTVSFMVTATGAATALATTGSAGSCAEAQVKATKFRARDSMTPVKFTVG